MEKDSTSRTGNSSEENWSGAYTPPETAAIYGLGLCGEEVIRPEQQAELDRDLAILIASRKQAVAQARNLPLD